MESLPAHRAAGFAPPHFDPTRDNKRECVPEAVQNRNASRQVPSASNYARKATTALTSARVRIQQAQPKKHERAKIKEKWNAATMRLYCPQDLARVSRAKGFRRTKAGAFQAAFRSAGLTNAVSHDGICGRGVSSAAGATVSDGNGV